MNNHKNEVTDIALKVRQFYEQKTPFRIYHGSTNSTRQSKYRRDELVDTSKLSRVLKVDVNSKTALVEPNVPMDRLVETTLQYGLIPPVVMEFPGITVGGGFAGTSGESSSFRYGLFENTINWIEMILANGEVVTASPQENSDLFHASASSFGTLGVTTLLEVQLIEAKTYVELTYRPVSSMAEAMQVMEKAVNDSSIDYLDGILFARDCGVICTGCLTNNPQSGIPTQCFTHRKDPWFYLHAKEKISAGPSVEAIPLVDYLFRYDRGAFWGGMYAFKYFMMPFNYVTRRALDRYMHTRVMYHALHKSGIAERYIVQDVGVPFPVANEFLEFLHDGFAFYPLWLCPVRMRGPTQRYSLLADRGKDAPDMLLNFGIWGPGPRQWDKFVDVNRTLEQKVQELNGMKCLYAHAYYTEDEFWSIYNRKEYEAVRAKYSARHLPTVYDKVKVEKVLAKESWIGWLLAIFWSIWPLSGIYGVVHARFGGDYLLPRATSWKIQCKLKE